MLIDPNDFVLAIVCVCAVSFLGGMLAEAFIVEKAVAEDMDEHDV